MRLRRHPVDLRSPPLALLLLALAGPWQLLAAQTPPETDIWMVPLQEAPEVVELGEPTRLTDRPGYDNQPHFLPGGETLLYTSIGASGQADIWRLNLRSGERAALTRTAPESEYSPTLMPGGEEISVVRVEADSTQRLWRLRLDGTPIAPILEDLMPVGYHAWATPEALVLFVLGDPPTLQVAYPETGESRVVAENIGRTLLPVPGTEASVSFLHHRDSGESWITELDLSTDALRPLVRGFPENEYYAWTPSGTLLTARGGQVHAWREGWEEWRLVADLTDSGITEISRLAVSREGDRLALVAAR